MGRIVYMEITNEYTLGKLLLIDKALEWTSFDVVNKIRSSLRRSFNIRKIKVGHAGTLDPLATGLVIVCTGKMTKRIDEFQAQEKEYIATLRLGATTPSYDAETEVDASFETSHIDSALVERTLPRFMGEIQQLPPIFSAISVDGQRAYKLARKGEQVELKPRTVRIDELEILDFNDNELTLRVVCSKGTYIRSLAHDIGKALQSGAYLTALRRTRIGRFMVADAQSIEQFTELLFATSSTHES